MAFGWGLLGLEEVPWALPSLPTWGGDGNGGLTQGVPESQQSLRSYRLCQMCLRGMTDLFTDPQGQLIELLGVYITIFMGVYIVYLGKN